MMLKSLSLGAAALFLAFGSAEGQLEVRQPASVSYQARVTCPALCSLSGATPTNWTVYQNLDQLASCQETVFYHMSIYDSVDNDAVQHRIYACTSFGAPQQPGAVPPAPLPVVQTVVNATFTLGAWNWTNSTITPQNATLSALSQQMRKMFAAGYAPDNNNTALVLFARSVSGTAGLYLGKGVQLQNTAANAMVAFEDWMMYSDVIGASAGLEFCQPGYDADHVFGFIAISNTSFAPVQNALQSWANATCLSFDTTVDLIGTASFTTPLIEGAVSDGILQGLINTNTTSNSSASPASLARRGDCTTVQVVAGDSCGSLATKCGITAAEFTTYNPSSTLCSTLAPGQHVCCSTGTLPDFAPQENSDGSCATYTIVANDNCDNLAATYSLTVDDIENFNNNTWAWNGCSLLYIGNIICLSSGTPPMPAPLANAVCGPQVPGTAVPASGTANVTDLNPCPLNACCDVWGQCGITAEFCTDTNTGAPGTAKPGTNGCISNCGTEVVQSDAPTSFISLAYYEGFGMDRPCLYQDVRQIDTTQFTHLHFAFGALDANYSVSMGDALSTYEFNAFTQLTGVQRVVSFGGWAFSTDPSTYDIFRTGVTAANRLAMATSIADFINLYDLDGVDIDWEYPGEPDIPGIPADSLDSGANYLEFLVVLKNLLPGKTVSIAAPASYWYLKAFPIAEISKVVDYIVFMTYDLHGQWDYGNPWSQDGCADGNCLRSHINLTETMTALAMITKAGVASNKVVVGVSSYGRSFAMADSSCYGPTCFFTGTASQSNAEVGPCTQTAGYISDAEVNDIITNNATRINQNFIDPTSNSLIVVYDDIQWVAMMNDQIRSERTALYTALNMGGSTNWASDLETYNDAPGGQSWSTFKLLVKSGLDPYDELNPTGNWTDLTCTDESVENLALSPSERWSMFDGSDAWNDVISTWNNIDSTKGETFTFSVADNLHTDTNANCGLLVSSNCAQTSICSDFPGIGNDGQAVPAVYEIWNSFVVINEMYVAYHQALVDSVALVLDPDLKSFEEDFAPVPPPPQQPVWETILFTVLNLVGTIAISSFFNGVLKALPIFAKDGSQGPVAYDNYKDAAKAFVSFSASLADEVTKPGTPGGPWTVEDQDAFSDYLGQVVFGWSNLSAVALYQTFSGSNASVAFLTSMISDGTLIQGNNHSATGTSTPETNTQLTSDIAKAIFAFAIPTLWPLANTNPFILDSGYNCGDAGALTTVSPDVQQQTGGCYNGKQYYLVWPSGSAKVCEDICSPHCEVSCGPANFSAPPGLQNLDGTNYGGINVSDLITGSLRTYEANGNANGGAVTDPTNPDSLSDLLDIDVTTPGFIRIPVCSSDVAYAAWSEGVSTNQTISPNYPCFVKPSPNECGISTFIDETSSASPLISDCMGIVTNIQGTQGKWEEENAIEQQHQIVQYGGCKFGVQGTSINGNIDFFVGAQDIVDVINSAVQQFGSGGLVGAKGTMSCSGDVSTVPVLWGLY